MEFGCVSVSVCWWVGGWVGGGGAGGEISDGRGCVGRILTRLIRGEHPWCEAHGVQKDLAPMDASERNIGQEA